MKVIIKKPVISEKSISQGAANKYIFAVAKQSTKREIAKAVAKLFKVTVTKVNTLKLPGKPKQFKRMKSYRADRYHAVVTLKQGDKITLFEESSKDKEDKTKSTTEKLKEKPARSATAGGTGEVKS